jgi:glycosyltransferase involved in cell wall biosynthesis
MPPRPGSVRATGEAHPVKILMLEPFFGGSHRDFALGLQAHSRHAIELLTLPDRFWKWRMRGAALHFRAQLAQPEAYDLILATSLMSLADFAALCPPARPPLAIYFHESQLTYPFAQWHARDLHFGFTDITSALAADRVWFNSQRHREAFLEALPGLFQRMPDSRPTWIADALAAKSNVLHPGCRFAPQTARNAAVGSKWLDPPLIIWNHRWEHDKNPEGFIRALEAMRRRAIPFQVAFLGQSFRRVPPALAAARETLGAAVVHMGFAPSAQAYHQWLARGALVVSTAIQENFGLAVVEAIGWGCLPLLPDRLSYPEIIPPAFHGDCLYRGAEDLVEKLADRLTRMADYAGLARELTAAMARFAWEARIADFDRALETAARRA